MHASLAAVEADGCFLEEKRRGTAFFFKILLVEARPEIHKKEINLCSHPHDFPDTWPPLLVNIDRIIFYQILIVLSKCLLVNFVNLCLLVS